MRTILLLTLLITALLAPAQIEHIRPNATYKLPTDQEMTEYLRLTSDGQTRELTESENLLIYQLVEENGVFEDLYSGKCSWYCGGVVDTLTATSTLPPAGPFAYDADNAHDFDHTTAWVEGVKGPGIGQAITYQFAGACPRITEVKILNGYVKTAKAWRENNRVKQLMLYFNDKPLAILDLEDSRDMQCFDVGTLGYHDPEAPSWQLRFEILDVYRGTKYDDTAITELIFDGIDVH